MNSGMLVRMTIERIAVPSGAMLVDRSRFGRKATEQAKTEIFDPDYWQQQKKVVARSSAGRGGVLFIRDDQVYWALRHYQRGGWISKISHDSYWWRGEDKTRSFSEWRILHTLRTQGLPVPTPVAARYSRSGFTYRCDLITEALPAVRTLADSIVGARLIDTTWQKIGATIAKFHRAGVHHADLNAHNILLGESAAVWLLDFDRGQIRQRGAWESKVLARLHRSLEKIRATQPNAQFNARNWQELMVGYGG